MKLRGLLLLLILSGRKPPWETTYLTLYNHLQRLDKSKHYPFAGHCMCKKRVKKSQFSYKGNLENFATFHHRQGYVEIYVE